MKKQPKKELPTIGWREWVGMPNLGVKRIKAKVDTGARSSSLHASDIETYEISGVAFVRFKLHPSHKDITKTVDANAKVYDIRTVKSSSGETSERPVILTNVELLGQTWLVELTLANRNEMGFRMLLGREAIRDRFLVDAGNSYYGGRPKRKKKQRPDKG